MFGPFLTGTILFLALWGTIFMAILGGLFYNQSVGLFENLPKETKTMAGNDWKTRMNNFDSQYQQNAYNCWIACGVYIGIAVIFSLRACCLIKR
uniref:Uncharacterized protein n=1 Tax=Caenorhabditis japonica TaxID=281687 RepID=A0A8R1DIC2_CAEJA